MSAAVTLAREDGKTGLRVVSQTEIATFRRCIREWAYRYVFLRRPRRVSEALRFGSLFHLGLNAWWRLNGSAEEKLGAALLAVNSDEETDPFEMVKVEELLLGYTARWGDEPYETVDVETEFRMPLVNPETGAPSRTFVVGGKTDVRAFYGASKTRVVIEHKTTSSDISQGSMYWRKVSATDAQVSTYLPGARASGFDASECIYDVVRKVALKPKLATPAESRRYTKKGVLDSRQREMDETPEEFRARVRADIEENPSKYFARGPIVRLEHDEREHAADVWQTAFFMREARNGKRFPRSPNACERYHRLCSFFDVCSGVASIDDENLFRTSDTPHEELNEI